MRKQQEKTDRLSLIILAAFLVLSTSHFMCRFDASGYIEACSKKHGPDKYRQKLRFSLLQQLYLPQML